MLIFFIVLSIVLFFVSILGVVFIYFLSRSYHASISELEEFIEEYMKEDEANIQSMQNLLEIFEDFLNTSKIIGQKYDLVQYSDYSLFLTKLYQIENIIRSIVVTKNNTGVTE